MLRNSETSWGVVARALHWGTGLLILGLFAYGLWMTEFPVREDRAYHYAIHASVGISILALMIARVIWRAINPLPLAPQGAERWEVTAGRLTHFGLYVLFFWNAHRRVAASWIRPGDA
jgi:cytochrome b561